MKHILKSITPIRCVRGQVKQVLLYVFVGGVSAIFDIVGFWFLRGLETEILTSSIASFIFATVINYGLCQVFVFKRGRYNRACELVRLFVVSLIGLLLNTLFVYFLVVLFLLPPLIAKIMALFPVFIWNFFGRKFFVFFSGMPK